jgi:hypothetical protein
LTVLLAAAALLGANSASAQTGEACNAASERAGALQAQRHFLDARQALVTCAAATCPDVIRSSCLSRLDEVNRALPSIVFDIKDNKGRDVATAQLKVDGIPQANPAAAITLDPGDHEFRFEEPGQEPVVRHFVLRESEQNRREPIVMGTEPSPPPAVLTPPTNTDATTAPQSSWTSQKTIGLVVGSAGIVVLVVGSIFGGLAISSWGSANSACPSHSGCSAPATSDRQNALTYGTVSTVGFVAGAVLVAGGLTLFLTAPTSQGPNVGVQMAPGGLVMTGRF